MQHTTTKKLNWLGTPGAFLLPVLALVGLPGCDGGILPPEEQRVHSVEVIAPGADVEIGAEIQMSARVRDRAGLPIARAVLVWSSSDTAVASVSSGGMIHARAEGTTSVSASADGVTGTLVLTVLPRSVAAIDLDASGEVALPYGGSRQITATARAADGTVLENRTISWASSSEEIVVVAPSGKVTATGVGVAQITASSGGRSASLAVRVTPTVHRVEMEKWMIASLVGEITQVVARPRNSEGNPVSARVEWTSSAPSVASVDSMGRVTAHRPGSATITATSQGKIGLAWVTVGTRWEERALIGAGGRPLPGILYRSREMVDGELRRTVFRVTGGTLLTLGGRYQLRLHGSLEIEGDEVQPRQMTISSNGVLISHALQGYAMFYEDGTDPDSATHTYRGNYRADGTLALEWQKDTVTLGTELLFGRER